MRSSVMKKKQNAADAAIEKAVALEESGDIEGAARAFFATMKLDPEDSRLPEHAGDLYLFHLNRPLDAIPCYEKAIPLFDAPEPMWLRLGLAHSLAGHDAPAVKALTRVLDLDSGSVGAQMELGKHHLARGRAKDAVEHFDTALALLLMQKMSSWAQGAPPFDPHVLAIVLMGKARACLIHLDRLEDGMSAVAQLFGDLEDNERGVKLASELQVAGKHALAANVLDALLTRWPRDAEAKALRATLRVPDSSKRAGAKTKTKTTASKKRARGKTAKKNVTAGSSKKTPKKKAKRSSPTATKKT